MVSADESRPETRTSQIKGKAKSSGNKAAGKTTEKRRKPSQKPDLKPEAVVAATEVVQDTIEQVTIAQVAIEQDTIEQDAIEQSEQPITSATSDAGTADAIAVSSPEPAAPAPVDARAITDAYGSFTRKSLEQTSSFFEQLAGARSFNKAFELQTEFARAAFETFVDESRKIRELHRELAKERLRSFEGFLMGRRTPRAK